MIIVGVRVLAKRPIMRMPDSGHRLQGNRALNFIFIWPVFHAEGVGSFLRQILIPLGLRKQLLLPFRSDILDSI